MSVSFTFPHKPLLHKTIEEQWFDRSSKEKESTLTKLERAEAAYAQRLANITTPTDKPPIVIGQLQHQHYLRQQAQTQAQNATATAEHRRSNSSASSSGDHNNHNSAAAAAADDDDAVYLIYYLFVTGRQYNTTKEKAVSI
mmetsp:Transcript_9247/g.10531  ORF Transcript_9247/g.10531 Transcript_9247/m.10531 type:complete len:141 (+) Transcript_9247:99-521(+)